MKFLSIYRKRVFMTAGAVLSSVLAVPAMAVGETFTPGSSAITKSMLDPVVNSLTGTVGVVAAAAFVLLGFGLSIVIGFRVVKGLFKTVSS